MEAELSTGRALREASYLCHPQPMDETLLLILAVPMQFGLYLLVFGLPAFVVFRLTKRLAVRALTLGLALTPASVLLIGILASDISGPHRGFYPDVFTDRDFLVTAPVVCATVWSLLAYAWLKKRAARTTGRGK